MMQNEVNNCREIAEWSWEDSLSYLATVTIVIINNSRESSICFFLCQQPVYTLPKALVCCFPACPKAWVPGGLCFVTYMKLAEVCIRVMTSHAPGDAPTGLLQHIHWVGDYTRHNGNTRDHSADGWGCFHPERDFSQM